MTTEAARMIRPDRPRRIDAVIDYFGELREAGLWPPLTLDGGGAVEASRESAQEGGSG
jgi:hypothetical protein